MFAALLFLLGFAGCLFAGLVCFSLAKFVKWDSGSRSSPEYTAIWNEFKTAIKMYSQNTPEESPTEKALRSWTGTLVICAGLCMIGILLEVDYGRPITPESIAAGFFPIARVTNAGDHVRHQAHRQPAANSGSATPTVPAPTE
jgi:SAM-dependent MidA family methyltransferase